MKISVVPRLVINYKLAFMSSVVAEIERSLFLPGIKIDEMEKGCASSIKNADTSICVTPLMVAKAKVAVEGTSLKVATIIGYPYGYPVLEAKLAEAVLAMVHGADEIALAVNLTALKNNDWQYLAKEINTILPVVQAKQRELQVLVEASLLTDDELVKCCDLFGVAGVQFLSLSAGSDRETVCKDRIKLARLHLNENTGIKLNGKEYEIHDLLAAGANRIVLPPIR